jgi:hypothetical protein
MVSFHLFITKHFHCNFRRCCRVACPPLPLIISSLFFSIAGLNTERLNPLSAVPILKAFPTPRLQLEVVFNPFFFMTQ